MCMEDVRIGRKARARSYAKALTTTSTEVVPYNENRVSLVLSTLTTGSVTVSLGEQTTDNGLAILASTGTVLKLNVRDDGQLVYGPIWAAMTAATGFIGIAESVLEEK